MWQLFRSLDFGTAECTVVTAWIVFLSRTRLQFACWYCHKRYVREENHDKASAHFSLRLMDMHSNKKLTKWNLSVSCIGGDGELLGGGIQGSEQPVCSKSLWNSVKPGISAWQRKENDDKDTQLSCWRPEWRTLVSLPRQKYCSICVTTHLNEGYCRLENNAFLLDFPVNVCRGKTSNKNWPELAAASSWDSYLDHQQHHRTSKGEKSLEAVLLRRLSKGSRKLWYLLGCFFFIRISKWQPLPPCQSIALRKKQVLLIVGVANSTTSQRTKWKVLVKC